MTRIPITSVKNLATQTTYVGGTDFPHPSRYFYSLSDVSAETAGRTQDGKMDKAYIGSCVKIELAWNYIRGPLVAQIMTAFTTEYMNVTFFDPITRAQKTVEMYAGDKSADCYNIELDLWTVKFNLIQRTPTIYGGA